MGAEPHFLLICGRGAPHFLHISWAQRPAFPAYFIGAAPGISCITEIFLLLQEALRRISQFRAFCKKDLFLCQVFFLHIREFRIFARNLSSKTRRISPARRMQRRVPRRRVVQLGQRSLRARRLIFPAYFMNAAPCISCITEIFLILQEALRCIFLFRAFCKKDLFLH